MGQELFYLWFTHRRYSFHISILLKNLLNRVTSFLILYEHFEYPIKYIGFISLSPSEKIPHLMTNEKKSEYRYFYSHSPAPGKISSLALRTKTYFKKNCEIDTGPLYPLNPSIHTPCPASGVPGVASVKPSVPSGPLPVLFSKPVLRIWDIWSHQIIA